MTAEYFSDLNYSLGNEDTKMEVDILLKLKPTKILTIAGCGSRALPLLACSPEKLICIDVAKPQLLITKLRYAALKEFSYQDFMTFWGFAPYDKTDFCDRRKDLFTRLELQEETKSYFAAYFAKVGWKTLLYEGKWEKTFSVMSKAVRLILGKAADESLRFDKLDQQIQYYNNKFPKSKWKLILFLLGNKSVFNALLYKGDFIKKNVPETHFEYYQEAYERLFNVGLVNKSFFMHLCFQGKIINENGNTIEADEGNFMACKEALASGAEVKIWEKDLVSASTELAGEEIDYASLSDVPSYFSGELEKNFMQKLLPAMKKGGVVVLRNYLREPEVDTSGFEEITPRFSEEIRNERVQMYKVRIFQKN
ncbi:MAG: S-adenosylmethionine-diacylglycerol 3-amino-3-carboxypropyl transferase [Bacteriovoracaceae bacterium]|jgi:S-adenosylmethionine-diacylglycerol 3-amino-3-carboxypropyl transferase